jgi:hypothetical protein
MLHSNVLKNYIQMKIKRIIIISCLIAGFGCSDFLDEQPVGKYTNNTFYQTEEHAKLAIIACYEKLLFSDTDNRLWVFAEVASDDAIKGGVAGDQADIGLIDDFQIAVDNGNLGPMWAVYYEGIARCNQVIAYVPDIDMDDALKNRIIGEAYFLRGYYYFILDNIFGNIPLVLEPKEPEDMNIPNSTRSEVYSQCESDFLNAIDYMESALVSDANIYSSSETGRATPASAKALLAKTYLFEEKWAEAATTASEIETYGYSLMNIYQHNFNVNYENNDESIFEIQHLSGQSPIQGNCLNQWLAPRNENGYGFDLPTQDFVDEFEVTSGEIYDPRLDYTLGRKGQEWFDGEMYDTTWSSTGYSQKKYLQPTSELTSAKGDGDLNFTVIRFAEILLIKAEALCELNRCGEALTPLNKVRKRARESYLYDTSLSGYGSIPENLLPDVTTTDQTQLRKAIRHERRVELGFEGQRYFDIIRYGETYANNAFKDMESFNYETHKMFPIPESEMLTNSAIKQNSGY